MATGIMAGKGQLAVSHDLLVRANNENPKYKKGRCQRCTLVVLEICQAAVPNSGHTTVPHDVQRRDLCTEPAKCSNNWWKLVVTVRVKKINQASASESCCDICKAKRKKKQSEITKPGFSMEPGKNNKTTKLSRIKTPIQDNTEIT